MSPSLSGATSCGRATGIPARAVGRKGATFGRSAISPGSIVRFAGIGTSVHRNESPSDAIALSWCACSSGAAAAPTARRMRSGGCSRVLGDAPRSTTRPAGSVPFVDASAVTRTMNLSRSIVGNRVRPLPTTPSLTIGYITGVASQATYVWKRPSDDGAGSPLSTIVGA